MDGTINLKRKTAILLALSLLALGYAASEFRKPVQVSTQQTTEENKQVNNDIKTVKTKVTKPDGTIVERERTVDKSQINEEKKQSLTQETIYSHQLNAVGLRASSSLTKIEPQAEAYIRSGIKLFGPITGYVEGSVSRSLTNPTIEPKATIGIEYRF